MNTGVGSYSLLPAFFPTQGLKPGLPHCRWILYQLSHQGSPWILEWIAYPFSRESSQSRVSCLAGRLFTSWATREAKWLTLSVFSFNLHAAVLWLVDQVCLILCDPMGCILPGSFVHGDSPGKNTGVGCHAFLQGVFPTQGWILWLLHCRQILYPLSHPECHLIRNRTVSISQLGIDHVAWSVMCSIGSVWAPPSVRWGWALKLRIGTEQSIAFLGRTDA